MNIQQLRAQIAALQSATMDENKNFRSAYDEGKFDALSAVDALLDSLQEGPAREDLEEAASSYAREDSKGIINPATFYYTVADKARIFKAGAKWQKEKDSILPKVWNRENLDEFSYQTAYDLSNDWAKETPTWHDVEIACKLGANWKEEQFEKERLKHCDELTPEQAQIESDFVAQHLKKNNRTPTFIDAIEYGMDSMEQQIKYQLDLRLPETLNYNGLEVSRVDVINDIIKAMKHE